MYPELEFAQLPFVLLPQRDRLPCCAAIYFALDGNDRILYIGQATNLQVPWQVHHRLEQLLRIHRHTPIRLHWLDCSNYANELNPIEAFTFSVYHPLLNRTQVPAKKIIPAELRCKNRCLRLPNTALFLGLASAYEDRPLPTIIFAISAPSHGEYASQHLESE
jgi:hypothetical protein